MNLYTVKPGENFRCLRSNLAYTARNIFIFAGVQVFAMWTDRKFYPAQLVERARDGFWQVLFLSDDVQKVLPERSLLLFSTFECDQAVLALCPEDDCYKSGVVTDVKA